MFNWIIYQILNDVFDYGKHLSYIKKRLSNHAKAYRQEWAIVI